MEEKKKNHEIDVVALIKNIFREWKTLLVYVGISAVLGLVIALAKPRVYTTEAILAPEFTSGTRNVSSNLLSMASTLGVNIGSQMTNDAIYPMLYPEILSSQDFILELKDCLVRTKESNAEKTFMQHIQEDSKSPFWLYPLTWFQSEDSREENTVNDVYKITKEDLAFFKSVKRSVDCIVNQKTMETYISVTDQDPLVSAIVVDTILNRLQKYIIEYRTTKARKDLDHYTLLAEETESRYNKAKEEYIAYSDGHQNIYFNDAKVKASILRSEMENEYNRFLSYKTLCYQAEEKIQEEKMAFFVIQKPKMPDKPSGTSKKVILLLFMMFGAFIGSLRISWSYLVPTNKKE